MYYGEWVIVRNLLGNMRATDKDLTTMHYVHFAGPCKSLNACIMNQTTIMEHQYAAYARCTCKGPFPSFSVSNQISRQFQTTFQCCLPFSLR